MTGWCRRRLRLKLPQAHPRYLDPHGGVAEWFAPSLGKAEATCGGSARRKRGGRENLKGRRRGRLALPQAHPRYTQTRGGVAEWLKAAVLKTAVP